MDSLKKIHKVSENLTLFGNVANAIDYNFENLEEKLQVTEDKIPQSVEVLPGIENYATRAYVQNVVTSIYSNGEVSLDAYATKKELQNKVLALSTRISTNTEQINILKESQEKFTTQLSDDTHVVFQVGNIDTDTTVADLKEMTLSEIIQQMLFKETWPDQRSDYNFFCDIKVPSEIVPYDSVQYEFNGVQIGPDEKYSKAQPVDNKVSYKTNASEVSKRSEQTSKNSDWDTVTYIINCKYDPKDITVRSNFGNEQTYHWDGKTEEYSRTVKKVYPTYICEEHFLISDNKIVERTLSGSDIFIAVPYKGTIEPSVKIQLNTLGWLDANMETWEVSTIDNYENTNHKYKKWKYTGVIEPTPFRFDIKWQ